jgi:putative aldouronate transport system permease protein
VGDYVEKLESNLGRRAKNKSGKKKYRLLFMAIPLMILVILFHYVPLFGYIYAFFDYKPGVPLFQNEFVGFKFFKLFLTDRFDMVMVMKNTLTFALIGIALSPLPMILAVLINEVRSSRYKKLIQTATTFPNFVSWIIVYSLAFSMFSSEGLINDLLVKLGLTTTPIMLLDDSKAVYWFQTLLGNWKGLGWSAIIYLAAIAGIEQELYEAAAIDGANRLKLALHITFPGMMPTFIVLLLLSIGNFLNIGFEQYFVFKNPANAVNIEVLDVYVYRVGLMNHDYSYGVAIGIMKSVLSIALLFIANKIAKKVRGASII